MSCAEDIGTAEEPFKGRGIVDCNNSINNSACKECGNGGTKVCCDPYYELGCDIGERRSRDFWQRRFGVSPD